MINYMDLNGARTLKNKILAEIDSTYQKKSDAVNIDTSNLIAKDSSTTVGNIAVFDSDGGITDSGLQVATLAEVNAYLDTVFPL